MEKKLPHPSSGDEARPQSWGELVGSLGACDVVRVTFAGATLGDKQAGLVASGVQM